MADGVKGTYQMLWDCPFCGTRKLLGLTHRHCPTCGAVQDPSYRYFPSDADKVAVENHVFVGADRLCPACQAPNSARSRHCGNCGSPLEGAAEVQRRADQTGSAFAGETEADAKREAAQRAAAARQPLAAQARVPAGKPKGKKALGIGLGCGCLFLLAVAAIVAVLLLTWSKPTTATAMSHSWSREVEVEVFKAVQESGWCDSKPSSAYDSSSTEKVRSHDKIPDGEDCTTVRVDNGDGTFSEKEKCTTKYREEPVYDDWCTYKIDRWEVGRTERATGGGTTPEPEWPRVSLSKTGTSLGAEREGKKTETYVVHFVDAENNKTECEYDIGKWQSIADGSEWKAEASVLAGTLDCDSLGSP